MIALSVDMVKVVMVMVVDDSDGRDSRVGDGEIVVIGCDGGFW